MSKNFLVIIGILSLGICIVLFLSRPGKNKSYQPKISYSSKDTLETNKVTSYKIRDKEESRYLEPRTQQTASSLEKKYIEQEQESMRQEREKRKAIDAMSGTQKSSSGMSGQRDIHDSATSLKSKNEPAPAVVASDNSSKRAALMENWGNHKPQSSAPEKQLFLCLVHKDQVIIPGQVVNLRTGEEIAMGNMIIPKNTLLTGVSSSSNNRLMINIQNIRFNNNLVTVNMTVLGSDGNPGLPLTSDALGKEAKSSLSKEAVNQAGEIVSTVGGSVAGSVGRSLGNLVKSVGGKTENIKNKEITLYDRQSLYLKIN